MGKRRQKKVEVIEGLPLWMGTFSDLVTLLLTFFIMLLAMASFDDTLRVEAVVGSIREALGADVMSDVALMKTLAENLSEERMRSETVNPLNIKLRQAMSAHVSDEQMRITQQDNELRLRLDDKVFFQAGSAELHPGAYALLADIGAICAAEDIEVHAEGHTDASGDERKNWVISAMRAVSVVEALRMRGPVEGERLSAVGMGSFRPASTFGEDTAWNRRIELVLRTDQLGAAHAIEAFSGGETDGGR